MVFGSLDKAEYSSQTCIFWCCDETYTVILLSTQGVSLWGAGVEVVGLVIVVVATFVDLPVKQSMKKTVECKFVCETLMDDAL